MLAIRTKTPQVNSILARRPAGASRQHSNGTMSELSDWLTRIFGITPDMQGQLLHTLAVIVGFSLLRLLFRRVVTQRIVDPAARYRWQKTVGTVAGVLMIFILLRIWFPGGFRELATFFGLLSAGLAIALQGPILNAATWLFLLWRRPFVVGDRIQIGPHAGDVIDIRLFQFTLLEIGNWVDADQSTGRVIHVPNGQVFSLPLANYSRGFQYIWNEIPIVITFESNWRKAKQILLDIANRHDANSHSSEEAREHLKAAAQRYLIYYSKLTPTVYTSLGEYGVVLTVRYLTHPRRRRGSAERIWEDVLTEFAGCSDILFAYPTTRFYNYRSEGKPVVPPFADESIGRHEP